jgi:hypothetical protein
MSPGIESQAVLVPVVRFDAFIARRTFKGVGGATRVAVNVCERNVAAGTLGAEIEAALHASACGNAGKMGVVRKDHSRCMIGGDSPTIFLFAAFTIGQRQPARQTMTMAAGALDGSADLAVGVA